MRAWKRTVDLFRAAGAANVSWFWAPNSNSSPGGSGGGNDTTHWNNWRYYYPGDSYVDWVGQSAYNFGDNPLGGSTWRWMQSVTAPLLIDYRAGFGGRTTAAKPFALGEWGCHATPGGRGFWFSDAAGYIASAGIDAILYFDTDDSTATYGYSDTQSLAAYKEMGSAPAYGGKVKPVPVTSQPSTPTPPTTTGGSATPPVISWTPVPRASQRSGGHSATQGARIQTRIGFSRVVIQGQRCRACRVHRRVLLSYHSCAGHQPRESHVGVPVQSRIDANAGLIPARRSEHS